MSHKIGIKIPHFFPLKLERQQVASKIHVFCFVLFLSGAGGSRYNPSYSGGRDQEDRGSKPAW
jgi:hypothetical protein